MRIRSRSAILLAVAAVSLAVVSAVLATPPSGILSGTVVARAPFVEATDLKFKVGAEDKEVIQVRDARETVMQQIVIAPGGSTGWHSHPGPVVVLIKSGEMTFYDADDPTCTPRTYATGDAFIDRGQGHVHLARNLSLTDNVEVWATYFDVPPGQPFRLDAADPGNCSL